MPHNVGKLPVEVNPDEFVPKKLLIPSTLPPPIPPKTSTFIEHELPKHKVKKPPPPPPLEELKSSDTMARYTQA